MIQPTPLDRSPIDPPSRETVPGSTPATERSSVPPTFDGDPARLAAQALARLGRSMRWAMLGLGIVWGASRALGWVADGPATPAACARAVLDAAAIAMAFGLAGWVSDVACRVAAAEIVARSERYARSAEALLDLAGRAVAALERLPDVMGRRPIEFAPGNPPDHERARLLAEIDEALRASRLDEAESLLDRFDAQYTGDPALPALRDRFDATRREEAEGHLARIDAARQVNDPDRVLELYRDLGTSLDFERRGELERDLARWFLDLIHRRLRVGRIQVDVVQLATRAAETFGATVEGASLRASLPVLRRSVGLCPRCAQPYVGTDAACPQCLTGTAGPPPGPASADLPPDPEPDP